MLLTIDHVMFPVYLGDQLLDEVEWTWKDRGYGNVFREAERREFLPLYCQSSRFYVEYLSNRSTFSYWSNAVFVVVPKVFWDYYKEPAHVSEHFLIPYFGSGYQLVSPEFPHLNSKLEGRSDEEFKLLVSPDLFKVLSNVAGQKWSMPDFVSPHSDLKHMHDVAVLDSEDRLVAPLYQANPALRGYF
ncbi:hypothetical protein ABVF61_01255 [Roseibium sp. HPY-6]|uniref:hypothetical protein n=1 Tax=Roseibium sp. HPY-6 TaxID=3229852 RepID=UPI00338EA089